MKRKTRNKIVVTVLLLGAAAVLIGGTLALILTAGTWKVKLKESQEKVCNKGWECSGTKYCCNQTITDFFKVYQFENLFAKRNFPVAKAVGFWDYQAFITAASLFENQGFCTTGGIDMQMMELCAFLGHVGAKTSCMYCLVLFLPHLLLLLRWGGSIPMDCCLALLPLLRLDPRDRLIESSCRWIRRGHRRSDGVGPLLQPRDEPRPGLLRRLLHAVALRQGRRVLRPRRHPGLLVSSTIQFINCSHPWQFLRCLIRSIRVARAVNKLVS
uniref:chitinase n=1 Tax=Aegilops tauschii subsp. strangulata TaxID=200361 RepID=A0A453L5S0_AEGTS